MLVLLLVADFGFAKDDGFLTTVVGTPEYMAPEIYGKAYGSEVDLWALGGIAYFMLCGTLPMSRLDQDGIKTYVQRVTQIALPARFSSASKDFVSRLLTKDVEQRLSFEDLPKHPFISSCINFSILVNPVRENEPPSILSYTVDPTKFLEAFVPSASKSSPGVLLWKSVVTHVLKEIKGLPGVPAALSEDPSQVYVFAQNREVGLETPVEFSNELSFANIEVFVCFKSSMPMQLKLEGSPKYEFLDTEKTKSQGSREESALKDRAARLLKLIHTIHDFYLYVTQTCATALKGTEMLEKVCTTFVKDNFVPALDSLYKKIGEKPVNGFFTVIAPGHTDDMGLGTFNESNKAIFSMVIQQYELIAKFLSSVTTTTTAAAATTTSKSGCVGRSLSLALAQMDVTISGTAIIFDRAISTFYSLWNALADLIAALPDMRKILAKINTASINTTTNNSNNNNNNSSDGGDPLAVFREENDLCKEFLDRHPTWSAKVHLPEIRESQARPARKVAGGTSGAAAAAAGGGGGGGGKGNPQTSVMIERFMEDHAKCIKLEEEVKRLKDEIEVLKSQLNLSMNMNMNTQTKKL